MNVLPIETRYFDNNSGSHYDTVRDSLRICVPLCAALHSIWRQARPAPWWMWPPTACW